MVVRGVTEAVVRIFISGDCVSFVRRGHWCAIVLHAHDQITRNNLRVIIKVSGYQLLNEDSSTQSEWVTEDVHCPSSAVRFMHSTQGRIHLQSSCQCRKFIWSELRFPRTLPPPMQSSRETSHPNDLNTWWAVAPTIVKFLHLFKSSQAPRHITGRRSSLKRSKVLALLLSRWNKHQKWRTVFSLSQ